MCLRHLVGRHRSLAVHTVRSWHHLGDGVEVLLLWHHTFMLARLGVGHYELLRILIDEVVHNLLIHVVTLVCEFLRNVFLEFCDFGCYA